MVGSRFRRAGLSELDLQEFGGLVGEDVHDFDEDFVVTGPETIGFYAALWRCEEPP